MASSLFKKTVTFIQSEGDTTLAYKVASFIYEIILFSRSFHLSAVYRMESKESKTLQAGEVLIN